MHETKKKKKKELKNQRKNSDSSQLELNLCKKNSDLRFTICRVVFSLCMEILITVTLSLLSLQECCGVGQGEGCCMAVNKNGLSDNHEAENEDNNVGLQFRQTCENILRVNL